MASATAGDGERPPFLKPEDPMLLSSHEADYLVEHLRSFDIEQVGNTDWLMQHESLEKLNLQAHYNTMAHCDEFVMGALISHDKLGVLIHEILIIEIWMEKIFPCIIRNVTKDVSMINLSLTIHHEASIAKLLEVILFHYDACEAMDSDSLLELADFCYRKLVYLNTKARDDAIFKERNARDLLNMSNQEEIQEKASTMQFQVGMCALTIVRYLAEYANSLPLCVMARLIDTHDVIMALIPLIENPTWKRERKKGEQLMIEKYVEGKWTIVSHEDYLKVTKSDAQVWLALYNLVMEPSCRARYRYNDYRRDQVLKIRKHLNEILINQIPILKDLKWVLEEISLNVKPSLEDSKVNYLIMEQVPILREKLLLRKNWEQIAATQLGTIFLSSQASTLESHHIQEMLRMFQFGESMEVPKCTTCGAQAVQRCSRCKNEWYCGRNCQKIMWKTHKRVCDIMKGQI